MKLTLTRDEIKDFACWDERVKDQGWEFALAGGTYRDCSPAEERKAESIRNQLRKVDPDEKHWGILRASHWAVGWYEHIIVDTSHEPVMKILRKRRR